MVARMPGRVHRVVTVATIDTALARDPENADTLAEGPVRTYRRTVAVDERGRAVQTAEFRLAVPYFAWIFLPFFRAALRTPDGDRRHWWFPPDRFDARASSVLGTLCAVAVVFGYLNTLFSQTIAFAGDEFGASNGAQGVAGGVVRTGGLLALVLVAMADRRGRRSVVLATAVGGCLLAATGALAPSLGWLAATQVLTEAFAVALLIVVPIIAVEELPAGSRAYAIGLLAMSAALGAGFCIMALRLADLSVQGWRFVYVIPLLGLLLVPGIARRLPETRRFERRRAVGAKGHSRRFWLLVAGAFLLNLFIAPDSQFNNRFLKHERGFSGGRVALLSIGTGTPGALGVIVGGLLADRYGRRPVAAVSLIGGTAFTVLFYFATGWLVWIWALIASVIGGAQIPALGVYGPELFPTALRGRANGLIYGFGLGGAGLGLVAAGALADHFGRVGPGMAILALGPVLLAVLVLAAFPETAGRELEELNPEDQPLTAG